MSYANNIWQMRRNHAAVAYLITLGFSKKSVREALHRLAGETQVITAKKIGIGKNIYANAIRGFALPENKKKIAEYYKVDENLLWDSKPTDDS